MKKILLVLSLFIYNAESFAQQGRVWIFFRDKGSSASQTTLKALDISERALTRRAKVLPPDKLIDTNDLPVAPEYIRAVQSTGASVVAQSRWLNAVSVSATPGQLDAIRSLPCVQSTEAVVRRTRRPFVPESVPLARKNTIETPSGYGQSFAQLDNINVVSVHQLGIFGDGVLIGLLDNGYNRHATHTAMRNINVVDEYDFIYRDTNTNRESWEWRGPFSSQGDHGTYVLSALAGFAPGILIGPAYGSSFMLGKTEIDSVEVPYEEDLYVEGIEWLERGGVDVISTSLGYIDWYSYWDLNGRIATTTKAVRILASKGIVFLVAMGNEGPLRVPKNEDSTGTLIAPADADSIIAVGAVYSDGEIAEFSSTGPTADGRLKPEVVAQGVSVFAASPSADDGYARVSGTSLSTPLTAGVAALILSAHPELTPMQVREAITSTARRVTGFPHAETYPNNYYGHGMVDALAAILYHGPVISNMPLVSALEDRNLVTVWAKSNAGIHADSVRLYWRLNWSEPFRDTLMTKAGIDDCWYALVPDYPASSAPEGYVSLTDGSGTRITTPRGAPLTLHSLLPTPADKALFLPPPPPAVFPTTYALEQNYPNPFNAGTTILYSIPQPDNVRLTVYDVRGRKVRTLYNGPAAAGTHRVLFDGRDESGAQLSSGVYFYRLAATSTVLNRKLLLLK